MSCFRVMCPRCGQLYFTGVVGKTPVAPPHECGNVVSIDAAASSHFETEEIRSKSDGALVGYMRIEKGAPRLYLPTNSPEEDS